MFCVTIEEHGRALLCLEPNFFSSEFFCSRGFVCFYRDHEEIEGGKEREYRLWKRPFGMISFEGAILTLSWKGACFFFLSSPFTSPAFSSFSLVSLFLVLSHSTSGQSRLPFECSVAPQAIHTCDRSPFICPETRASHLVLKDRPAKTAGISNFFHTTF